MPTDIRMPLPASEQIRTQIVELNFAISKDMEDMWVHSAYHKKTKSFRIGLMSKVKRLYHDTRPYMVGYSSKAMKSEVIDKFIKIMDDSVYDRPSSFTLRDAMNASYFINQFLADFGITAVAPKRSGI